MNNSAPIDFSKFVKKYDSVETTVTGPETASNGKLYYIAQFQENTDDDDGYGGQSKAYKKLFFEDTHSLLFLRAEKAVEEGIPMKIKAMRMVMQTERPYNFIDKATGKVRLDGDGNKAEANTIVLFLIADENPLTEFNRRCNQITRDGLWAKPKLEPEDTDPEETDPEPPKNTEKKKGK